MLQQNVNTQHSILNAKKSISKKLLISFLSSSYHHWWKGKPWHVREKPLIQVRAANTL